MKKLTIIFALLIALLTGCSSGGGNKLDGAWDCEDYPFSLVVDGSTATLYSEVDSLEFDVEIDGDDFTLSDGEDEYTGSIDGDELNIAMYGTFVKVDEPTYDGTGSYEDDYEDDYEDESDEEELDLSIWYGTYECGDTGELIIDEEDSTMVGYDLYYSGDAGSMSVSGWFEIVDEDDIYTLADDEFTVYYNIEDGSIELVSDTDDEINDAAAGIYEFVEY